jgi:hypothetical protein
VLVHSSVNTTTSSARTRSRASLGTSPPLPDMDGILRRVSRAKFRSVIDLQNAFEQICIDPRDVQNSAMATPDGPMLSEVLQQGDCNAPATFQTVMNDLFAPYLGRFVDIYLDDVMVYSENLEDHVEHVRLVIDILRREKFFLTERKLNFLCEEVKILGRVVDDEGIRMDPDKVDALVRWKTPTNRDLLRGFLGAAGFLADDIDRVRVPMGVLHALTGDTVPFRWEYTHQRAFEDVKNLATLCKDHHRRPLKYGDDAPPVNIVTDGCGTGIAGVVSQGEDWKTADVAAFFSAKLNPAQQNYPVHEIEMLAGIETMMRHRDILQGVKFCWYTDHKGLIHLLNQRDLSGRQARWLEKVSEFDFNVIYAPGTENILSDALSRLYSNDEPGTVRARSEYTYHNIINNDVLSVHAISMPVLVGKEGEATLLPKRRGRAKPEPAETGRPETSREFAARMKVYVVLKGPKERTERESTNDKGNTKLTIRIPARKLPVSKNNNAEASASGSGQIDSDATDDIPRDTPNKALGAEPPDDAVDASLPRETLVEHMQNSVNSVDLPKELTGKYNNDSVFRRVLENPKHFKNFEVSEGLIFLRQNGVKLLCIPNVTIKGHNVRELVISEAHSLLAHLGPQKTVAYLRDHVWWKDMINDVKSYCNSCITCKRSKPNNQKPYGLLNPLAVPTRPWESIGIDFVGPLPESKDRNASYDCIVVIICLLTAMVHLVPGRINYTARQVAELVFAEVYKHHGLPKSIVSDRDVLFTSTFWKQLHELIGTKLNMSSAYHPESDGSTERANRTVTQMIRQCVSPNQKDWCARLPGIEFAINSATAGSTGYAPFFLNTGRMPRSFIWESTNSSEYPGVSTFAQKIKSAIMSAHDSILAARVKQTRTANRRRQLSPFKEDDLVYISTNNMSIPKKLARKLVPKYVGPYLITKDYGNNSYKVKISARLKQRGIHDVFHASLLRIHVPNDDRLFPGRLDNQIWEFEDAEHEWAVERIKSHSGAKTDALFEIVWKSGDITWLPYHKINHLDALQQYYDLIDVDSVADLPEGHGKPPKNDLQIFLGHIDLIEVNSFEGLYIRRDCAPFLIPSFPFPPICIIIPSMARQSAPIISSSFKNIRYDEAQRLIYATDPIDNTILIYHPCQVRLFLLFDHNLRSEIDVNTPPAGYLQFARVVNMEPDILGALSVTSDGKEWDLPAIPLTRKDIDLSTFAVDGGIVDPDLDVLGFYKGGQLDMDQVNHHVRLALERLRRYDNKGSRNRRINDSAGDAGPSRNGRRARGLYPQPQIPSGLQVDSRWISGVHVEFRLFFLWW